MLKKLIFSVVFVFVCGYVHAAEIDIGKWIESLPAAKQGIAFSVVDSEINYLTTVEIFNYKIASIEAGYSSNEKLVGVFSVKGLKIKDYVNVPILNLIEFNPGVYLGFDRINRMQSGTDWGISATFLEIKF